MAGEKGVNGLGALLQGVAGATGIVLARAVITALGAPAQVLLVVTAGDSLAGTWVTLFVVTSAIGMVFPVTMSLGQTLGRSAPGAASVVLGGPQFLCGAVASPLVGLFGEGSSAPMAGLMLGALVLALLLLFALARLWQGHGEVAN